MEHKGMELTKINSFFVALGCTSDFKSSANR